MGTLRQATTGSFPLKTPGKADQLALYDQYSSMAYGIILRIIPDPDLAQRVLVDLFASSQLLSRTDAPTTGEIIRLARAKALEARPITSSPVPLSTPFPNTNNTTDTAKLVFNLSFCEGCTLEAIAEKLNFSPTNVLKAFYTYFNYLRSS
jgi:hypothetical protein